MKPETFTFTTTVALVDADGTPIRIGSVLREIKDGEQGVVTKIAHEGDRASTPFDCVGDIGISLSRGTTRFTNRYDQWRHVPRSEQTYSQRLQSWLLTPYEHDDLRGVSREEALAIDGIMSLLPEDIVNWEDGPWPDSFDDALRFLTIHLENLGRANA